MEAFLIDYIIIHPKWYHCSVIAFYLPGEYPIYFFSLLIGMGVAVGLGWISWRAPEGKALQVFDLGAGALAGSLVGGRLVFIFANWLYYDASIKEIPQVQLGGIAWPGAFTGWVAGIILVCMFTQEPWVKSFEVLLPLAATIAVSAWLGCWVEGCAYGFEVDQWWGLPARDEWGTVSSRIPVQLLGSLWTIFLFWLLESGKSWKKTSPWLSSPGSGVFVTGLGLALGMLGLSFLRADPAPMWNGLRLESWGAMVIIAALLFVLIASKTHLLPVESGEIQRQERR